MHLVLSHHRDWILNIYLLASQKGAPSQRRTYLTCRQRELDPIWMTRIYGPGQLFGCPALTRLCSNLPHGACDRKPFDWKEIFLIDISDWENRDKAGEDSRPTGATIWISQTLSTTEKWGYLPYTSTDANTEICLTYHCQPGNSI